MDWKALAMAALLVVSSTGAAMAVSAGTTQSAAGYSGTHVSFDTTANAVTGYTVDGDTVVSSVQVQSTEQAWADGDVDADLGLSAVTDIAAAAVDLEATANTNATLSTESGAELTAHDNDRGILVVSAGDSGQVVHANVSNDAEASAESDDRVAVTTADGPSGTFIVVGEGSVTVDETGNVTAQLAQDGTLVYRQYEGERSESEKQQERLIANGTAAAEVYVQSAAESTTDSDDDTATPTDTATATEGDAGDAGDEARNRTVDVVRYSEDTTVEVTERTESGVNMTVERAESEGRVVITSVSEAVVDSTEDVSVTVDGEAAARADSYAEVRQATQGGETSTFLVQQSSSAEASYDVVVGINHFSERNVAVQDGSGSSSGDDTGSDADSDSDSDSDQQTPDGSSGDGAGFGVGVAVVALAGAALLARHRA
jgi:PGF-CTERM protein